jgi:4-amino-4-deoxy-L-arabinose transferase-like glycosyltransferase
MTSTPLQALSVAAHRGDLGLLWIAVVVALCARLLVVFALPVTQFSDMAWYYGRAIELLETGRYAEGGVPTAFWPVGYPAFLAGMLGLFGRSQLVGQLANVALSVLCVVLLHRWCLVRFGSPRIAGIAALALAVYPNHLGYSVGLYSEPLFTALLLCILLLVQPQAGWQRLALAGVLAGLATLVKAQTQLLGPILLLVLAWGGWNLRSLKRALGLAAVGTAFMVLTIAPWTLRNWQVMGEPVPVSTNGGISLLSANNPSMTTSLLSDFAADDDLVRSARFSVADQVAADARARALAWGWIRANPERFIALMPKKLFRLWVPDGESEWVFQAGYAHYDERRLAFRTVRWLNQAFYVTVLVGFVWALWRLPRAHGPNEHAVPLMVVFFSLLSMVFSGQSRYHAPLMPFMMGYAAWAWVSLRERRP